MAKAEKFLIENISLNDLIKEDFLEEIKKINPNISPISLVFISETGNGKMKQTFPLMLNHQSNEEVKNRKMHIESQDTELVEKIIKFIEENKNGKK